MIETLIKIKIEEQIAKQKTIEQWLTEELNFKLDSLVSQTYYQNNLTFIIRQKESDITLEKLFKIALRFGTTDISVQPFLYPLSSLENYETAEQITDDICCFIHVRNFTHL